MTIWYISKYCVPTGKGQVGGRGYLLMRELANIGHSTIIIASDSNHLAIPPKFEIPYYKQKLDGVEFWWLKTFKYSQAKSISRIISWLHFEWRLFLMPLKDIPNPDVVIISSLSLLSILNGFWLKFKYRCSLVFEVRDIWP